MKAIVRNSSHGNSIIVSKVLDDRLVCQYVEKTSLIERGIEALKKEYQGYAWYNSFSNRKIDISREETRCKYCLRVGYVDGIQVDYRNGLLRNSNAIRSVIRHCCEVWGRCDNVDGLTCVHGDLSLYNVIFTNSNPVIIDWEHFSDNSLPIGFDALYLLFVSLFFEIGCNKYPTQRMLSFISEQIAFVKKSKCLACVYEKFPLTTVIKSIYANGYIWNLSDENIIGKLPILQWSNKIINYIDVELRNINERKL